MKIYMSYTKTDRELARKLGDRLRSDGLSVWDPGVEIFPGDNWGKSIGKALDTSDAMVVIVSPESAVNDTVRRDISFAIGNERYAWRLIPVYTPSMKAKNNADVPSVFDLVKGVRLSNSTPKSLSVAASEVSGLLRHSIE